LSDAAREDVRTFWRTEHHSHAAARTLLPRPGTQFFSAALGRTCSVVMPIEPSARAAAAARKFHSYQCVRDGRRPRYVATRPLYSESRSAWGNRGKALTISGTAFGDRPNRYWVSSRENLVAVYASMFLRAIQASWFQRQSPITAAAPINATRRANRFASIEVQVSMPSAINASDTMIMYTRAYRRAAVYP